MNLPMYKEDKNNLGEVKNIIALGSGKGGVGKSTLTANLAFALQYLGYTVGVLDADIYGPSIQQMIPEDQEAQSNSENNQLIEPALARGIKIISFAYFKDRDQSSVVRAPVANGLIERFLHSVSWGPLDFLLIDFPPGTGDVQLTLAQKGSLTGSIVITTPQEIALLDVRKAIDMFHKLNIPIIGVVENMSYFFDGVNKQFLFGEKGGSKLAAEYGIPFLGEIPIDPQLCRSGDLGKSLFDRRELGDSAQVFLSIAKELCRLVPELKQQLNQGLAEVDLQWQEIK